MARNRAPAKLSPEDYVPRNDAYTGLLSISFFAMFIGCLLLFVDWFSYDTMTPPRVAAKVGPGKGGGAAPAKPADVEKKAEPKEAKKAEPKEVKKDDAKKDDAKKDDAKEMKKDDAKKDDAKKDDAKKDDAKKDDAK